MATTVSGARSDADLLGRPELVEVPLRSFLAVDGHGTPGSTAFRQAVAALLTVSGAARDVLEHRGRLPAYDVRPPETLWGAAPRRPDSDDWSWTTLVEQPAGVTSDIVVVARIKAAHSVPGHLLSRIRWWHWREGRCAQLLYPGPYADADVARHRLDTFIRDSGQRARGRHHELCLGGLTAGDPAGQWSILRRQV